MQRTLLALSVLVASVALAQSPKSEDEKTIYAVGLAMGKSLAPFSLTPGELDMLAQGMADQVTGAKLQVEPEQYQSKFDALARARQEVKSKAYLEQAGKEPGAALLPSGLIYTELKAGTGEQPKPTDTVKVNYRGTLVDGTEFDSSYKRGQPAEFPLGGVIPCWTEGVGRMKVGGKAKLVCPSKIAYGDNGHPPAIPGGATLVFEVELLEARAPAPATIPGVVQPDAGGAAGATKPCGCSSGLGLGLVGGLALVGLLRRRRAQAGTLLALGLAVLVGDALAASPQASTEDEKTLYALGATMGRSLAPFNLTKDELAILQKGLRDQITTGQGEVDLTAYQPKFTDLMKTRSEAISKVYLDKAAKEKGAKVMPSGLIYVEQKAGKGAQPVAADSVKVNYRGTLTNGTEFDSSYKRNQPAEFPLGGVIPCWTEGVAKMKVGGKAKLICPSKIAYGDMGRPPVIPPAATLIFEIELLEVKGK